MSSLRSSSVVCVGTLLLDAISVVEHLPGEDERVETDVSALSIGGNAANAAITLARLGINVDFVGAVGDDQMGHAALAGLAAEGIGTSGARFVATATTASSLVIVSRASGSRTIVTHPAPALERADIPVGYDWLHVDKNGYAALRSAGGSASRVSLDDGNPVPDLDLRLIDVYAPTIATLHTRYPRLDPLAAGRAALSDGAGMVIATAGSRGSFAVAGERVAMAQSFPITPVSTLGAGDVFHGALLAALILGQAISDALRFANVTAALSCLELDGHAGVPDRATVEQHVAELPPGPADPAAAIRALGA